MFKIQSTVALFFITAILISCKGKKYTDPLTPEQAIKSFQLNEDFDIQVYAAEPLVKDPVTMIFDDRGTAFVVEMPDYPYQPEPGKGKGRIKALFDINKDGRIDSSIVFADNLMMATSILPWKGGLIVTAAPDILFMKDTTGDFKADIKEALFTGFFKDNMEAQITALQFSIDNWIYAANYGREGEVTESQNNGKDTLSMSGADFRFRLDNNLFELESGVGQFGQAIDDWGHRFLTENSVHIDQPIVPWRYLHRHAFMPSVKTGMDISDHDQLMNQVTDPPYWRAERTKRRNKTYQEQKLDRIEYADDHFTGASGGIVYTGDAFPEKYYGNFFVTEVAGNLVHRDVLVPSDSSPHYIAKLDPTEKTKEFLASTDPWFRPTSLQLGSDGSLFIIDMYRQHIETPFAIPEDLKKEMDFMNGSEYGRIYRLVPKNKKLPPVNEPNFSSMSSQDLVKQLTNPNQQNRLRAQRILIERQDKAINLLLKDLFTTASDPRYKLHAFYLLDAFGSLDINMVKQAINDTHPELKEAGIKLAERYPALTELVLAAVNDRSPQVAFQAVLSAGNYNLSTSGNALVNALKKYGYDKFFRSAVLSSVAGSSMEFFDALVKQGWFDETDKSGQSEFLQVFSNIIAQRNKKDEILKFVTAASNLQTGKQYLASAMKGLSKGFSGIENKTSIDTSIKIKMQQLLQENTDTSGKNAIGEVLESFTEQ